MVRWEPAITSSDHNPQDSPNSGGVGGALTEEAISNIIDDNERVRAAFESPEGLTRISGEEERHVTVSVVMIVTDQRILFAPGNAGESLSGETGTLAYDDIAAVGIEEGDPSVLTLSMANGVRWEFPLPDADPDTVDSVVAHLRWIGELRARLVACRNDLELTAGRIREHAAEMEWEQAESAYEEVRSRLDRLIGAVQWTEPIDDEILAPELTEMERTLECAHARLYIERAESRLELGRQLVENEDYHQAGDVLEDAQQYFERAADRADSVRRSDDFRFGEHRALRDDLDRLEWEIEAVAAEPIRQAHEAKVRGLNTAEPAEAVGYWETAFRRYGNVLTLEWGDGDRQFAGDRETVHEEREAAADRLIECHRELARDRWNRGVDHEREGDIKEALRACSTAEDNMARAADLAVEFRPEDAEKMSRRHRDMKTAIREIRETATVESSEETDPDTETDDADGTGAAESLRDIDTHHEITFDMSIEEQAADGGRLGDHEESDGQESGDQEESEESLVRSGPRDAEQYRQ